MPRISSASSLSYSKVGLCIFAFVPFVTLHCFAAETFDSVNEVKDQQPQDSGQEQTETTRRENPKTVSTNLDSEAPNNPESSQRRETILDWKLRNETDVNETEFFLDREALIEKQMKTLEALVQQTPNFDNISINSENIDNITLHTDINGTVHTSTNETIHINANETELLEANETSSNNTHPKRWECTPFRLSPDETSKVKIANDSEISDALSKANETDGCFLLYFFLKWCHFCAEMSVEINTIGRLYPMLPVLAVDALNSSSTAAKFGVAGVPTLLLFYSGRPVVKFNRTRSLDDLQLFIKETTGFDPDDKLEINDADFAGPLPTKVEKRKDIYLTFSLAFLALLSVVITARTKTCQDVCSSIKERLSRLWRSVERQKQD